MVFRPSVWLVGVHDNKKNVMRTLIDIFLHVFEQKYGNIGGFNSFSEENTESPLYFQILTFMVHPVTIYTSAW